MANIEIDGLADEVVKEMIKYSEEIDEAMQVEISKISKEILNELKNDPSIPVRTGKYKKSFYKKTLAKGMGYRREVVANKEYRLTHLLEKGHAMPYGGRSKAYPHWAKAQEKIDNLGERIEEAISKS